LEIKNDIGGGYNLNNNHENKLTSHACGGIRATHARGIHFRARRGAALARFGFEPAGLSEQLVEGERAAHLEELLRGDAEGGGHRHGGGAESDAREFRRRKTAAETF
jgi:hypothetical protein